MIKPIVETSISSTAQSSINPPDAINLPNAAANAPLDVPSHTSPLPEATFPSANLLPARIGLIIIGDEILSGARQDQHFEAVRGLLKQRNLGLSWVQYAADDPTALIQLFRRTVSDKNDLVISCGGIGATPDDHTRQAMAKALDLPLVLHPQAQALITERCLKLAAEGRAELDMNSAENRQRLKMGEFPLGSEIIPNPFNGIPGFRIKHHAFVPGFPVMAQPMIAWLLDHVYKALQQRGEMHSLGFRVFDTAESTLTPSLEALEKKFAGVKIFSLPSLGDTHTPSHIELGVKGCDPEQLQAALKSLKEAVKVLPGIKLMDSNQDD